MQTLAHTSADTHTQEERAGKHGIVLVWKPFPLQSISWVPTRVAMDFVWGLIVLDSDSVFGHNWWFPPTLACPCHLRPYYEIPLDFFLLSSSFCYLSCENRFPVSAAPDLWLKLNIGKPWLDWEAWLREDGSSGPGEETGMITLNIYSQQSMPRGVKLGATTYPNIFICKARDIEYLW